MSGMANEMSRLLNEDGGQGLAKPDPATGAGPVPGNEGDAPPPAGASTTDQGAQGREGQPPDTIPYVRFKEVNDKYSELKGYEQLKSFGYDPDSLGRLAAFEAQYSSDPFGTLRAMAERLELPQELVDQIVDPAVSGGDPNNQPGPGPDANGGSRSQVDLPDEVKERLAYVDRLQAREVEAEANAQLARVEAAWDALDKDDGIETPRMIKLMAIQSLAGSDQPFTSVEDLAKAARAPVMEFRDKSLGSAIQNRSTGITPSLPNSGPVPTEPVNFGSDIRAASKAAQAAIERGDIPS